MVRQRGLFGLTLTVNDFSYSEVDHGRCWFARSCIACSCFAAFGLFARGCSCSSGILFDLFFLLFDSLFHLAYLFNHFFFQFLRFRWCTCFGCIRYGTLFFLLFLLLRWLFSLSLLFRSVVQI